VWVFVFVFFGLFEIGQDKNTKKKNKQTNRDESQKLWWPLKLKKKG
jgi:hypothetical protein